MYDVVIAGGGPAGLSAAARTAGAGLSTLIVERGTAIGVPIRTSGGSWIDDMAALGVPSTFYAPIRRVRVIGPSVEARFDHPVPRMCVLDVRAFYQWLAEVAIDAGATLQLSCRVQGVLESGGRVTGVGVRTTEGHCEDISARFVVDATGYGSALAKRCGLHDGFGSFGVGAEVDLYAPAWDPEEAVLIVGRNYAPNGYAWVLPYRNGRVRLGVGVGRPQSDADPGAYLRHVRERVPALRALEGASAVEVHAGLIPLAPPRSVPLVREGLLVAGDAAGQASALIGEGIRYAIYAGRAAGDSIASASAKGDRSDAALASYPDAWRKRERNLRFGFEIYRRVVLFDDADWDREVAQMQRLSPDQFAQGLKGDFTLAWLMSIAPRYAGFLVPPRLRAGAKRFPRSAA